MIDILKTETFDRWLRNLRDRQARIRVLERLDRLAHGNPGDVKSVGGGVSELRLTFGPGYRVYFMSRGGRAILLLCGGDKSTQASDIRRARELAQEWDRQEDGHGPQR